MLLQAMDNEDVDFKKNYPSLPPDYVSIAQLQERWLQRKQQEEDRQKAQAESKNRYNLIPKKGFSETPQNSNNKDVSDNQVYSRFKGKELDGFAGDNRMDKNTNRREIGEGNYKKKFGGVKKGIRGGGKEFGFDKIKGEKDCSRTQEENGDRKAGIEGTASVFMVETVREIVSKEIKPVEWIRKSNGKMVEDRENLRENSNWRVKISSWKSTVEELPENALKKEDLVLRGMNAPVNGDDDDLTVEVLPENKPMVEVLPENKPTVEVLPENKPTVEVLPENKPKKGALLESEPSKGSERHKRKGKKKIKAKKSSDSKDTTTLVETTGKKVKDESLNSNNGSSLQKGSGGRKVRGYRCRESVSENIETKITENFRGLSLIDSRKSNVTSRTCGFVGRGNYTKYRGYQVMLKPADNRGVWVKKGEISVINDVAVIDNSGLSKLEPPTVMDEAETDKEGDFYMLK